VSAPGSCAAGAPVEIGFGAFDSAGKLDFLDVTDLTAGKQLGRLEAAPDQKQAWTGKYRLSFERPGPRTILLRFVRFDGAAREPYSFLDKRWTVEVRP